MAQNRYKDVENLASGQVEVAEVKIWRTVNIQS